jgi:hypothetical protein
MDIIITYFTKSQELEAGSVEVKYNATLHNVGSRLDGADLHSSISCSFTRIFDIGFKQLAVKPHGL